MRGPISEEVAFNISLRLNYTRRCSSVVLLQWLVNFAAQSVVVDHALQQTDRASTLAKVYNNPSTLNFEKLKGSFDLIFDISLWLMGINTKSCDLL